MKTFKLILFSISLVVSAIAKADTIPASRKYRVAIQVPPLAFVDFYNGANYKFGTSIRLPRNFSLSADFAGYFRNFNTLRNNKGFNADFRVKYQFPNSNAGISVNYFYKKQAFQYHDHYIGEPETPVVVSTRKQVHCFNVNFEQNLPFLKNDRAYVTLFAGLGVRFRNVRSSFETKHDFDKLEEGGDSQSLYFVLIPGQNTWLNLNAGLRLGFYLF